MIEDDRRVASVRSARSARCLARCVPLAVISILAACIDFIEPDLPARGAPAVIEATLRLFDDSTLQVDARLAPGFDALGLGRVVTRPTLRILGREVVPDSVLRNGTHLYRTELDVAGVVFGPVEFDAPVVRDVGPLPVVRWFPARRVGPDTIDIAAGEDLVITTALAAGQPEPPPAIRQWTVSLGAGEDRFTIGANGAPPDSIVIPARWVPDSPNGAIQVRLVYQQTADLHAPPGDYIGLLALDTRINWVVRLMRFGREPRAAEYTRDE